MPIHRTRTLSSLSNSSSSSKPCLAPSSSRGLRTQLTQIFAQTTLGPSSNPFAEKPKPVAPNTPKPKRTRVALHVYTNFVPLPWNIITADDETDEEQVEAILRPARRLYADGKTPKGTKRSRAASPRNEDGQEECDETEVVRDRSADRHRPKKLLRAGGFLGDRIPCRVEPELKEPKPEDSVIEIEQNVFVCRSSELKDDLSRWTHVIHIVDRKTRNAPEKTNDLDEHGVHHLYLPTSASSLGTTVSLTKSQLKAGRDFLCLALPFWFARPRAESPVTYEQFPESWTCDQWQTEGGKVLIVYPDEYVRDAMALVATYGAFDEANTVEEVLNGISDAFNHDHSKLAEAANEIWEDWRGVEKIRDASMADMLKKSTRSSARSYLKAPVYDDEWEEEEWRRKESS